MTTLVSPLSPMTSSSQNFQSEYLQPNSSTVIDSKLSPLSLLIQTCKNIGRESCSAAATHYHPSVSSDVTPTTDHIRSRRQEPSKSDPNVNNRCVEHVTGSSNDWKKTATSSTLPTSLYKSRPMVTSVTSGGGSYGKFHLHDLSRYQADRNGVEDTPEVESNLPIGSSKFNSSTVLTRGVCSSRDTNYWRSRSDPSRQTRSSKDDSSRRNKLVNTSFRSPILSGHRNHALNNVSEPFQTAHADAHNPTDTFDMNLHGRSRLDELSTATLSPTTQSPLLKALAHQLYGAAPLAVVPDMVAAVGLGHMETLVSYLSSNVGADGRGVRWNDTPSSVTSLSRGLSNTGSQLYSSDWFAADSTVDVVHPLFQQAAATIAHYHDWYRRLRSPSFDATATNSATSPEPAPINRIQSVRPSTRSSYRPTPAIRSKSDTNGLSMHSPTACTSGCSCFRRSSANVGNLLLPSTMFSPTSSELYSRLRTPFTSIESPPLKSSSLQHARNTTPTSMVGPVPDLHVCSWLSASTGNFCGRRFADADSLFHHLRSHCNDQQPTNSSVVFAASRRIAQCTAEAFQTSGSSGVRAASSSSLESFCPMDFGSTLFKVEEEHWDEHRGAIASGLSSLSSRYHPYRATESQGPSDALGRRQNNFQRRQTVCMTASSALQSAAAVRL